jgi:hypothetical protein
MMNVRLRDAILRGMENEKRSKWDSHICIDEIRLTIERVDFVGCESELVIMEDT